MTLCKRLSSLGRRKDCLSIIHSFFKQLKVSVGQTCFATLNPYHWGRWQGVILVVAHTLSACALLKACFLAGAVADCTWALQGPTCLPVPALWHADTSR